MEAKLTSEIITAEGYSWKVLVVAKPGVGKTTWVGTAPDVGVAACETGEGSGALSLSHAQGVLFAEPKNIVDFRAICYDTFAPFQKKRSVALDSLSYMTKTFIKDHVLASFPAKNSREAMRRQAGVPVGFDYGDMAEVTRGLLNNLIAQKKHVIVTALEKNEKNDDGLVTAIGPDLPGALFNGAPGMFDTVLYMKVRKRLLDPKDPRSVIHERYFVTGNDGLHISKDRNGQLGTSFLAPEEVFNPKTGEGTFTYLLKKILDGHAAAKPASGSNAATLHKG